MNIAISGGPKNRPNIPNNPPNNVIPKITYNGPIPTACPTILGLIKLASNCCKTIAIIVAIIAGLAFWYLNNKLSKINYVEIDKNIAIERGYTACSKCGG